MSQRAKVLWVIALAILPLVALSGFTIWQQYLRDVFVVSTERTYFVQATAYSAEAFLDGQVAAVRALAKNPALGRARAGDELQKLLEQLAADNPDWQGIKVVGPEAAPSGQPVVNPARLVDGKPVVTVTAALENRQAALVVPLPAERFVANLMSKIGSPLVDLTVLDSEGQALVNADTVSKDLTRLEGQQVVAMRAGKTGADVAVFRDKSSLIAYAPVGAYGWGVMLTEPAVTAFAPARRQVLERSAVLAVILAVVGALGWTLAGRLSTAYQNAVQARAEAERLSGDLKRALHARDEFLAAASHDLRNPLSTIQSAAELLERAVDEPSMRDRLKSCADHIQSAAKRMAQQLDAFLDVSRLEAGRPLELKKRKHDLMPLVRQVVAECQQQTTRHRLLMEGPALLQASVDAARLQRVVGNLVGNAIKYSPDGGEVNIKLEAHDTDVILTVRDRGIGIPGQDQSRVFERFQRGTNVEGRFQGTGIGLAGARQIVEQHGGAITLKSQVGKGSTFTVRFPSGVEPANVQAA
ncbi:MAG TPA: ATP-binding protein [Burkholderiales bacterium]|nr:ATP-binding protein [Burkholderiales bacterium]